MNQVIENLDMGQVHLLLAGAIATRQSFRLAFAREIDELTGYDNVEVIASCCKFLSDNGYIRWFLKDFGTHIYLVCQEGDVWHVRRGKQNNP